MEQVKLTVEVTAEIPLKEWETNKAYLVSGPGSSNAKVAIVMQEDVVMIYPEGVMATLSLHYVRGEYKIVKELNASNFEMIVK